jgi:hypothetical protein
VEEEPMTRQTDGIQIRINDANKDYPAAFPPHPNNGDESLYPNFIGSYSKGLHHDSTIASLTAGDVNPADYNIFRNVLSNPAPTPADFQTLPKAGDRKHVNPQSGWAFDVECADPFALTIPPIVPPALASAEAAGEMVELYWMALLRDVPFNRFEGSNAEPRVGTAASELSALSDFKGPKEAGTVTRHTIFRGFTTGDLIGPYVSQFLLIGNADPTTGRTERDGFIRYGSLNISQRQITVKRGTDYIDDDYIHWLDIRNGKEPRNPPFCSTTPGHNPFDRTPRFIRNMRDLANYVHYDDLPQEFVNACLILLHLDVPCAPFENFPYDTGNPYFPPNPDSNNQEGFGTFGPQHILTLVAEVTTRALKACWFQKWHVHRRLRPEEFGGLIHRMKYSDKNPGQPPPKPSPLYPLHTDILNAPVLDRIYDYKNHHTYLLPQAYPEGCPLHPSYPSGHATIAGACVTILKAFFDENFVIPNPVIPKRSLDNDKEDSGTKLQSYNGPALMVGNELNKLASNIGIGRNMAGVHYRSDYIDSLKLGEQIAISILEDQRLTYN